MGEGQFSRVVEAVDRSTGAVVAVKVIRAIRRYAKSAEVECEILERVRAAERASGCAPRSKTAVSGFLSAVLS